MYKTFSGVKTKSITDAKKEFSMLVRDTKNSGEPTFILNHNKPEVVLLSNQAYEELVEKYENLQERIFHMTLNQRLEEGAKTLIPADEVISRIDRENPFSHLSDEELFD